MDALLSSEGNILISVLLLRLNQNIVANILSHCVVSANKEGTPHFSMLQNKYQEGTQIWYSRQIQEKSCEQQMDKWIFVDLKKVFETVNHASLWKILSKLGCLPTFSNVCVLSMTVCILWQFWRCVYLDSIFNLDFYLLCNFTAWCVRGLSLWNYDKVQINWKAFQHM